MGLSIVISGAIIMVALLSVLVTMPLLIDSLISVEDVSSQIEELEEEIAETSTQIKLLTATSGTDVVRFYLAENGTEKLWNYEDFTVLVTYDADLGGPTGTKLTEEFSFNRTASFGPGTAYLVPESEVSGGWPGVFGAGGGCSGGTPWNCIEEVPSPDNSDGIDTNNMNGNDIVLVEFGLTDETVSPVVDAVTVHYTFAERDGPGDADPQLIVELREGACPTCVIASWIESPPFPVDPTFTVRNQLLSAAEIASINDYNDLTLNFTADCEFGPGAGDDCVTGGGSNDHVHVSWGIVEVGGIPFGDPGQWIISSILNDIIDPQIVNSEESADIVVRLENQIFAGGDVIVSISTDNGVTATSAITAT